MSANTIARGPTRVTTDLTIRQDLEASLVQRQGEAIEAVLINGDLAKLSPEQRVQYYRKVCDSLGLNPLTKPFAYITLNGKLTLYALKDATEQLRSLHGVSIIELTSQRLEDVFVVTAKAAKQDGRTDAATGAVAIAGLKGENLANALMKAETKAKRRATLSICGLGMLDETEAEPLMAREPQIVVSAPPAPAVALPPGTGRILSVSTQNAYGVAVVTWVDDKGEQHEAKTVSDSKEGSARTLCEQLAQEGCPVEITTRINRNNATVIDSVQRYRAEPVLVELPPAKGEQAL